MEKFIEILAEYYFIVSLLFGALIALVVYKLGDDRGDKLKLAILYLLVVVIMGTTLRIKGISNKHHELLVSALPVINSSETIKAMVSLNLAQKEFSENANDSMSKILANYVNQYFGILNESAEDGLIKVPKADVTKIATILLESAKNSVLATSYVAPEAWWEGKSGRDYLEFNRSIIENNDVQIKRIFILTTNNSVARIKQLLDCNVFIGVETYIVSEDKITGRRREDVLIVDGTAVAGRLDLSRELEIIGSEFSSRNSFVNSQFETFKYILKQSKLYETESDYCEILTS